MRSWNTILVLLASGGLFLAEAEASSSAAANRVSKLEVTQHQNTTSIVIHAERTPTFTIFKLANPDRLVLDLMGVSLEGLKMPVTVEDGRVGRIAAASFKQGPNRVGRLIVGIEEGVEFDARSEPGRVVILIKKKGRRPAESPSRAPDVAGKPGSVNKTASASGAPPANVDLQRERTNKRPATVQAPDHRVVAQKGDPSTAPRIGLARFRWKDGSLVVTTSRPAGAWRLIEVYNPYRLALDVFGARSKRAGMELKVRDPLVKRIRAARHPGKVRVVLDLDDAARGRLDFGVKNRGSDLVLKLHAKKADPVPVAAAGERSGEGAAGGKEQAKRVASTNGDSRGGKEQQQKAGRKPAAIKGIDFKQQGSVAEVVVAMEGEAEARVIHRDSKSAVLEVAPCTLPMFLERTLDTSELSRVIRSVSSYRADSGKVRVVVSLSENAPNRIERRQGKLVWRFSTGGDDSMAGNQVVNYQPDEVAGYSASRPELNEAAGTGPSKRKRYRGKRITLEFKDADIHNILRLIADVAKLNIITSDEVKGRITISMKNVPWDQALEIILKTKKLGMVRHGNIIRVATLKELEEERKLQAEQAKAKQEVEPLRVRLIPVNYAVASDIMQQVKDILSERGSVSIDKRTNVLIVKDVLENLVKAEGLVRSLDTQTPQVLIEARIVEANTQFARELGVQWGGDLGFTQANGNPTGLPFPQNVTIVGGADDSQTSNPISGIVPPGHYAINLPAAVGAGSGGAIGFMLGSASGNAHLNLRLSALENQGAVKIISAPKITTLDNQKAKIGQGVSIPISVVSAAGVNTQFVEAKLELEVSPHITQEGSILLQIKVSKNEPDFSRTGARGDPTILKKEAETQVLVRDGDTTVIGGIYTRKTSETISGIPVLSQIPVLGWFFRNTKKNDDRTELLIFITPRIVNRLQATVSQR